jgi:hypothetical protein
VLPTVQVITIEQQLAACSRSSTETIEALTQQEEQAAVMPASIEGDAWQS